MNDILRMWGSGGGVLKDDTLITDDRGEVTTTRKVAVLHMEKSYPKLAYTLVTSIGWQRG